MRVYFAGMESKRNLLMARDVGAQCCLVSALSLMRKKGVLGVIEDLKDDIEFFCDSGAFTWLEKYDVYGSGPHARDVSQEDDVRVYFQELVSFYRDYGHLFKVLAEFDVGPPEVKTKFRQQLEDAAGRQVLPTWAGVADSRVYVDQLMEEYDYIGIGGFSGADREGVEVRKALGFLRASKVRAHLWGGTGSYQLTRFPLYSADSTSWMAGAQFGQTYEFKRNRLTYVGNDKKVQVRRRLKAIFEAAPSELGLDYDAFVADKSAAVNRWNLWQWVQWAAYLKDYWANRKPYWMCTCGSSETKGACKAHGLGVGGNPPPIGKGDKLTEETKLAISHKAEGNLSALVHGKRTVRVPQIQCDTCYLAGRCPGEEEGSACKYDQGFMEVAKPLGSRNWEGLVAFLVGKMEIDSVRFARGLMFEAADGGLPDKTVSGQSAQLSSDVRLLARLLGVMQPEGLKVDARQIQVIIERLPEEALGRLLDSAGMVLETAPQLLEGGEK